MFRVEEAFSPLRLPVIETQLNYIDLGVGSMACRLILKLPALFRCPQLSNSDGSFS